jgi:hypothetical protein
MSTDDLILSDVFVESYPPGQLLKTTTFETLKEFSATSGDSDSSSSGALVDRDGDYLVKRRRTSGFPGAFSPVVPEILLQIICNSSHDSFLMYLQAPKSQFVTISQRLCWTSASRYSLQAYTKSTYPATFKSKGFESRVAPVASSSF